VRSTVEMYKINTIQYQQITTNQISIFRLYWTWLRDSLPDFPVAPISPLTSRNISIGFQSLLALTTKFSLMSLRPKWGLHLNFSVTPSDFCPVSSSSTLPWQAGALCP